MKIHQRAPSQPSRSPRFARGTRDAIAFIMNAAIDLATLEHDLPHCACGTTRDSKYAVIERQYTTAGTLYLLWGGTAVPERVTFRCVKCAATFDSLRGTRSEMRAYVI
jgi:hypothetical protein